jgi:hypothetical protein
MVALVVGFSLTQGCEGKEPKSDPKLTVEPLTIAFAQGGEAKTVKVTSTSAWTADVSGADWITTEKQKSGKEVTLTAAANTNEQARTGQVKITNTEGLSATISVSQAGLTPSLMVSPTTLAYTAEGGNKEVVVTANIAWEVADVEYEGDVEPWVTYTVDGTTVTVTAAPTTVFEARSATLVLTGTGNQTAEVEITQEALSYSIAVSSTTLTIESNVANVAAAADDYYVNVVANGEWSVVSSADWVAVSPTEGGATDAAGTEVTLSVSENEDTERHEAIVTFSCGTAEYALTLVQRAAGLYLEILDKKPIVASDAGSTVVRALDTSASSITVTSSDGNWATGTVTGSELTVTVAPNASDARSTVLTLTATDGTNQATATLEVKQVGAATNLSEAGTANCYIVPESGTYKLDATKQGNGSILYGVFGEDLLKPVKMEPVSGGVLWGTTEKSEDLITDVAIADGWLYFTTTGTEGNAVVYTTQKVVSETGEETEQIAWSWHLWLTDYNPNDAENQYEVTQMHATQGIWMNRNLGALKTITEANASTSYEDIQKSFGMLYQWGRKDPFPGAKQGTYSESPDDNYGYQKLNTEGAVTPIAGTNDLIYYYVDTYPSEESPNPITSESAIRTSNNATDPNGARSTVVENVAFSIAHPDFYITSASPFLWVIGGVEPDATFENVIPTNPNDPWGHLWGVPTDAAAEKGTKTIYDPCPVGWKVPAKQQWKFTTAHGDASGNQWGRVQQFVYNCTEGLAACAAGTITMPEGWNGTDWPTAPASYGPGGEFYFPDVHSGFNFYYKGNLAYVFAHPDEPEGSVAQFPKIAKEAPEDPATIFIPAAGLRTYAGGLTRNGSACHYWSAGLRVMNQTTPTQVALRPGGMESSVIGNFYWGYRYDYDQMGAGCSVRCVVDDTIVL